MLAKSSSGTPNFLSILTAADVFLDPRVVGYLDEVLMNCQVRIYTCTVLRFEVNGLKFGLTTISFWIVAEDCRQVTGIAFSGGGKV